MKPFVPLVPAARGASNWRGLGTAGAPEAPMPDPVRIDASSGQVDAIGMALAQPEPEEVPEPEPDPELIAHIEALEARLEEAENARKTAVAAAEARERAQGAKLTEALARLEAVTRDVEGARSRLVEEMRHGVGVVILEAARRIAGDQLRVDPRLLDAVVEEAGRALGKEGLVVRVAPGDVELVQTRMQAAGVSVVGDPQITGGAICEGPSGSIDASLDSATAAIASVLEQWRAAP